MAHTGMPDLAHSAIGTLIETLSPCIVDLGARGGADPELLAIAWASSIYCFEPEQHAADQLARAGDSRWRQFTVIPSAVGGASGIQNLYVPEDMTGASLLRHNPAMIERFDNPSLHAVRTVLPVETCTLDELRSTGRLERVDYLKVDVEGAELDILKAGHTLLRECVALKVECSFLPQRIDQPLVWAVAQFLAEAGFEVMDLQDFHRWRRRNLPAHPYRVRSDMQYSKGQVAQCDLVLLKTAGRLEGPEQAMRLVVLSAALGFFDHARTVLAGNPEWAAWVRETHGFDIDAELRQWSATVGSRVVRGALRAQVRGLVPLLRAWAGRFQFPRPD
ncbi:MAG: FkbM family methyltransferase [Acidobacteria bacterium]|nr:FkbM family methyltransferase [Acidobacteriota bacterium]